MKYQTNKRNERIRRAKVMKSLADKGKTLTEIGDMQKPPISKQRVHFLIESLK